MQDVAEKSFTDEERARFIELVEQTDKPMKEIAKEMGYCHPTLINRRVASRLKVSRKVTDLAGSSREAVTA